VRESARKGLLNRRVFWRQELFLHLSPSIAVGADFFSSVFACASPKRGTGTRPSKQKSCYRITATAQFDLSVDSNPIAHHGRDRKGARERGVSSTTSCWGCLTQIRERAKERRSYFDRHFLSLMI
jgi:hypothetical protein